MRMMDKELNVDPTIVKSVRIHLDAFGVGHEENAINIIKGTMVHE